MFHRKSKTQTPQPTFRVVPESHAGRHGYTAFATADGHRIAWAPTLNGVVAAAQIATAA